MSAFNRWWSAQHNHDVDAKEFARRVWHSRDAEVAEKDRLLKMALDTMEEAYRLREGLCRNGDDGDVPTDPLTYDSYLKKWSNAIKAIKEAGK